ncbi:MAG: hypothetical protein COC19_06745 [SAR86 cluster bacterium]|uniref:MAPEG family protein n=1 Tax=SAR86 cluster bacterium TaxID=2030880 RepID=A0A2A4MIR8_9GAMM|nr:MAG: hypothetical protein COC19_06745 [SAR86 cluster bacterium]
MELVILMVIVALLEYVYFSAMVGRARGKFDIQAPAVSGNIEFERVYRAQQNTMEQLVVFIPAIFIYNHLGSSSVAAGLGLLFVIGRAVYFYTYSRGLNRGTGFLMGFIAIIILLLASAYNVIMALL